MSPWAEARIMTRRHRISEPGRSTGGIAIQIGLAEKFYRGYAGEVPSVPKLNGKTGIASDAAALSPVNATVADAVRLGADAVGCTLYVGTSAQGGGFRASTCR